MTETHRGRSVAMVVVACAVCVAAALLYRRASGVARRAQQSAMIDEASEESFPASDPPAFTPSVLLH